jgi:hypothetical protein
MKLRRHVAAVAGSLAMLVGLAGPVMADPNNPVPVSLTITEGGSFSQWLWGSSGVNIGSMTVTTLAGGTTASINQRMNMNDTRATSPGWSISIAASDFADTTNTHFIDNTNIQLLDGPIAGNATDCLTGGGDPLPMSPVNPSNPYQVITPTTGLPSGLGSSVLLVTGTSGRGCGLMGLSLHYKVTVPPGTYTGGTSTVYVSQLTLTEGAAPS